MRSECYERIKQVSTLVYEDKPKFDIWIIIVLGIPILFLMVAALFMNVSDPETSISLSGTAAFIIVMYWIIIPRKYCIMNDKIKINLGGPFSFNAPFKNIKTARKIRGVSEGVNFATSFRNGVEIVRKRSMNVNITPSNIELFLEELDLSLTEWRKSNSGV